MMWLWTKAVATLNMGPSWMWKCVGAYCTLLLSKHLAKIKWLRRLSDQVNIGGNGLIAKGLRHDKLLMCLSTLLCWGLGVGCPCQMKCDTPRRSWILEQSVPWPSWFLGGFQLAPLSPTASQKWSVSRCWIDWPPWKGSHVPAHCLQNAAWLNGVAQNPLKV